MIENQGGCVCGRVRYTTFDDPLRVTICHCTWCQRRTGSAFGVEAVFQRDQIAFSSSSPSVYRHLSDESGRWLDQYFCGTCGSNIGFTLEAVPTIQTIAAGTFDDPAWIDSTKARVRHVFMRSAQNWSNTPEDSEQYERHFRE